MATPFETVYDSFMQKISDYSFANMSQTDVDDQLEGYMKSSIVWFYNSKVDLSNTDETLKQFNNDLSQLEIEVIATMMVVEFLKPVVKSSRYYKQILSDSDFKSYSQANQLQAVMSLYNQSKRESSQLLVKYSFIKGNLEALNNGNPNT